MGVVPVPPQPERTLIIRALAASLARTAAPIAIGLIVLALWEAVVRINGIPPYVLPAPSAIAASLWTDGPSLLGSLLVTLRITLAALAAAALFGGAIALLFSRSRLLEISLFPYAVILQVTPIVAIAPLIIIWVKRRFSRCWSAPGSSRSFRSCRTRRSASTAPTATCWHCSGCTAPHRGRHCAICESRRRCPISSPGCGSAAVWR